MAKTSLILKVQNLVKNYGNFQAVKGITFEVKKGEIFALLGPNGAGKSTTLKILATILSPTSGKIIVDGHDLKKSPEQIRKLISYLPEEAGAYKNLSGITYLDFMASIFAESKKEQKKYMDFACEIANLKDKLKDKIKSYSKGMVRKLLLARTIMSRPKLAILDEPTSGLDVINALEVRKIIKDICKHGTSVILSSHNMLETEFLSDVIAIIDQGKIVETGTAKTLKKKYKADNLETVFFNSLCANFSSF